MANANHKATDEKLIELCLSGDRFAHKTLFNKHAGKMMSICLRYARSRDLAEDIMQDGFIRAFRKLHTFKKEGSFEGWLRTIMVNSALKELSKKHNKQDIISLDHQWDTSLDPEVLSFLGEEELLKLIHQLPQGYRSVFNMYAIEGYSHKEIGEALNIGESTSRSQLVKARNMLKKMVTSLQKQAV